MRENTDQKNSEFGHFLRSDGKHIDIGGNMDTRWIDYIDYRHYIDFAHLSDCPKFDKNKRIFLHTLPRTGFRTKVWSYCNISQLDWDPSREWLTLDVDQIMNWCGERAMSDNGMDSHNLKRTLVKS